MVHLLKKGSGIHIKKSHEGRFTEYCGGNVTEECIRRGKNSQDPKIRKQAVFAQNARKFKHQDGGSIYGASQIQTNGNLSQQWKQQQEMAVRNFNQSMEQKKQLDEMKRIQESQALGQGIGQTVGQLFGRGMQTVAQNIQEKKDQENKVGIIDGSQEIVQTTTPQATAPQTTTQQWQPSFVGLSFQPTAPWQLYEKTQSMRNGGNFENIMNMNELFSTYKSVEPLQIEKEVEIPDFKSRYDSFLENLNRYKTKKKDNNELTEDNQNWFGNTSIAQVSSSMAPSSATTTQQPDYTSKDLQTMLQEQGLDKYIKITSGYRDHNIGKAGNKSNHRKKNQHGLSMAYDIIPIQGETFDSIFQKIKENSAMQQWLSQNGFNINDETDAATLRRTGGTGAHFHIGPDKFNVRKAQYGLNVSSLFAKYNSSEIDKPTDKIVMPNQELIQQGYSLNAISGNNNKEESRKQESDQDWFNPETISISTNSSAQAPRRTNNSNMASNTSFDQDFQKYGVNPIFTKHKEFWRKLALSESSLNSQASNKSGAFGYFQIMPQSRTGTDVASQFKDAEKLMTSHMSLINDEDRKLAQQKGITEEGLMAGVWLGGPGGVKKALRNQGNAKDSNGTSVMSYMKKFS